MLDKGLFMKSFFLLLLIFSFGCASNTIANFPVWSETPVSQLINSSETVKVKSPNEHGFKLKTSKFKRRVTKRICQPIVLLYMKNYRQDIGEVTKGLCGDNSIAQNMVIEENWWTVMIFGQSCIKATAECMLLTEDAI